MRGAAVAAALACWLPLANAAEPEIVLDFEERDLREIVVEIGRATGLTLVFDDRLKGRLTLAAPQPATPEEAIAVLETALVMHGFAALAVADDVRRILPIEDMKAAAPLRAPGNVPSDAPIATLLRLEAADAETVSGKLAHLVSRQDAVIAYPPTNSLILVGSELRVARLVHVAQQIDRGSDVEIAIHPLRHRDAEEVRDQAEEVLRDERDLGLWADARTNRVIARGTRDALAEVAAFLAKVDRPAVTEGEIEVVPLLHRDPAEIASVLDTLRAGAPPPGAEPALRVLRASGESLTDRDFVAVPEPHTGGVLVQADRQTREIVRYVIHELDRPPQQVLVEMALIEVSKPSSLAFGFDFFLPLTEPMKASDALVTLFSNPSGGGIRGQTGPDVAFFGRIARDPLVLSVVDPETGLPLSVVVPRDQAVITATERRITSEIRARPSLVLLEGDEHELFVGDNIPIPVQSTSSAVAAGAAGLAITQNIERQDTGLTMRVRPTIGEEGIALQTFFELTQVVNSLAGDVSQVGPTLANRRVEATVRLREGEVAVIGVGQDQVELFSETGTPFLRSIPGLGIFFRARRTEVRDRQILVTIEARRVDDPLALRAESLRLEIAHAREKARAPRLPVPEDHWFALRVSGARSEREAQFRADTLERLGFTPTITRWAWDGDPQWDVYLGSFASMAALGRAQAMAEAVGMRPELVLTSEDDRSDGDEGGSLAAWRMLTRP